MKCFLCPRMCGVERNIQPGRCGVGENVMVARAALHFDEEPCISGSRGSGAVFFSGCPLGCVYCQNEQISRGKLGKELTAERLHEVFLRLIQEEEAHNLNLVTGTHFVPAILRALDGFPEIPVVWNTSGYERVETLRALQGKVSVYLPDLKYLDAEGAARYSHAPDYPERATAAIMEMARQVGAPEFDEEGVMTRGIMVRHLVLPGRVRESKMVLDWIAENLPEGTYVSLMAQYMPFAQACSMPEINRRVTQEEYDEVVDHLFDLGLEDGYVQELSAADASYIPPFDLTGV